ncbi:MAG: hypothetical protein LBE89_05575 [Helicobacteraceae bacterium]|nr:hypothetical protein [Helicobacteraceae bacterium]
MAGESTLVFEIKHGRGLFNFLMFFADEDIETRDRLFLYLRHTNIFIALKMYGNHKKGDFFIYINKETKEKIIKELDLLENDNTFNFIKFLNGLNGFVPNNISLNKKVNKLREIWPSIKNRIPNILDESNKTILFGIIHLPSGKRPREKTLRKLSLFTHSDADTIRKLIDALKYKNVTLAWTDDETKKEKSISNILSQVNDTLIKNGA